MGSCTHFDTGLTEAIAYEAGFATGENKLIVKGAGGADFSQAYGGWGGSVWIVAENRNGERWLAEVLWRRDSRRLGYRHTTTDTTIKWVEESMGPGDFDVPDNVWAQRPTEPPNDYAAEWRKGVEAFRAEFPDFVRNLTEANFGQPILVQGHEASGPWTYLGERQATRRSTVKVFRAPAGDIWRLPRREEQLRRCRVDRVSEIIEERFAQRSHL